MSACFLCVREEKTFIKIQPSIIYSTTKPLRPHKHKPIDIKKKRAQKHSEVEKHIRRTARLNRKSVTKTFTPPIRTSASKKDSAESDSKKSFGFSVSTSRPDPLKSLSEQSTPPPPVIHHLTCQKNE